jgi:hypothetical protein
VCKKEIFHKIKLSVKKDNISNIHSKKEGEGIKNNIRLIFTHNHSKTYTHQDK